MVMKHLIFDLDGTVIDTLTDLARAISDTLVSFNLPPITKKETEQLLGGGARQFVKGALKGKGDDPVFFETFFQAYLIKYKAYQLTASKPYPGMVALLKRLKEEGYQNFIFSNKPHEFSQLLIQAVLPDLFKDVHGHKFGTKPKPDTTEFFKFAHINQIDVKQSVFIGDSTFDIEMGKHLGMPTIAVTYGYMPKEALIPLQPDYLVDHVDDIYMAIKQLEQTV
jgi:phosphoglycolate phosphatase